MPLSDECSEQKNVHQSLNGARSTPVKDMTKHVMLNPKNTLSCESSVVQKHVTSNEVDDNACATTIHYRRQVLS